MVGVNINRDVLQWALDDAAMPVDQLAQATGRSKATVQAWLTGDATPQKGDVTNLAKALHRSSYFFLLPAPPPANAAVARFRSRVAAGNSDSDVELSRLETVAIRKAQYIQKSATLAAPEGWTGTYLPAPGADPEQYAADIRAWLGWTLRMQYDATSKSAAFREVRQRIEDANVLVLLQAIGDMACRGFSLPARTLPLIYINSSFSLASVRLFTLLHEFAHVARGVEKVCHEEEDSAQERWCDQFAAAFLLPASDLYSYVRKTRGKSRISISDKDDIRLISDRFKASWLAVAIRLERLGLAEGNLAEQIKASSDEVISGFVPGGRRSWQIRLDDYGRTFAYLVTTGVADGRISKMDGRRLLNADGKVFSDLAQALGVSLPGQAPRN